MTDTRKVQLEAGLDASGVRKGAEDVKAVVRDMAQDVQASGQKAAKAVDGIGAGGEASAKKLDRATNSIIGSIERTTAAMKSGERGTAAYFETLAKQRGVNADTLKPYLEGLRQAEAAQKAASGSLDNMGMSAKATAAALRGVPAQFTDIATSIAGGQKPLTVFLQQGGQLKDLFGGIGPAARALGGYVLGLVNPFTLAAAAAGALAYAYNAGANEAQAFQRTVVLSGQVAGVTAGRLSDMAAAISAMGGGTQGRAAEVLNSIAGSADIGAANMQRFVAAALRLETVGGPAAEETAKAFASLAKDPLQAALKLNEATNFLTRSTYDQIKALTEQGRTVEAAQVAQAAYADAIEQRTPQVAASLGIIEGAWLKIKKATKESLDAALSVGRADTAGEQIRALQARITRISSVPDGMVGRESKSLLPELSAQLVALQQGAKYEALSAFYASERAAAVKAGAEWDKESDKYLSKQAQQAREIAKAEALGLAAGKSRADIERQIAAIREKVTEKKTGQPGDRFAADRDAAKEWAKFYSQFADNLADAEGKAAQLTRTQAKLVEFLGSTGYQNMGEPARQLALQEAYAAIAAEQLGAATKAYAQDAAAAAKAYGAWIDDLERGGDAATRQAQALRDEDAATALVVDGQTSLKQAIELVIIARLKERQVAVGWSAEAVAALQREIDARQELVGLIGSQDARKASADSAKQAAADWKRASEQIETSITDALLRGFESGKGVAATLRDTVVNMFKSLVLRPVVSAIVNPIAGAITGSLGLGSAANAAGSAGGAAGGLGSLGNLAGIGGALGTFGSLGSAGVLATIGGQGLGASLGAASTLVQGGNVAGGLGFGLGSVAPYALAAYAVYKILTHDNNASLGFGSSKLGADGTTSEAGRLFDFGRGTDVGKSDQLQTISDAVLKGIAASAAEFGGSATGLSVQAATDIDKKGKGAGTIRIVVGSQVLAGVQTGGTDPLAVAASKLPDAAKLGDFFAGATSAAIIAGLQASDLPAKFSSYFDGLDAFNLTKEQADAALASAAAALKLGQAFEQLGGVFAKLDELSVAASDKLLAMFGGLEGFNSAVTSYFQAFYSDAERTAIGTKQLTDALAALGLALPATREQYRALVDAQDITTDAGQKTYGTLISLSGAFASLTEVVDTLDTATQTAGKSIQAEIDRLRGTTSTASTASLQARFAIATAQGRAGDVAALQALPDISKALEEAAKATATSALDVARIRAWLASSLGDTLATVPGFASGGSFAGGLRIVGENGPELQATGPSRIYSTADTARLLGGNTDRLEAQIAALTEKIADLQEATRATAMSTHKTATLLQRAMPDGDALATRVAVD